MERLSRCSVSVPAAEVAVVAPSVLIDDLEMSKI